MVIEHQPVSAERRAGILGLDLNAPPSRRDVHRRFIVNWAAVATVLGAAFLALCIGAMLGAGIVMNAVADRSLNMGDTLLPCPTEDSVGCYWDAETMGNGQGHDIVELGR